MTSMEKDFHKAIKFVALANLSYFFIEFFVALKIDSVSLFADSVDFLEDASVNFLILLALGFSLKARARVGMLLAVLLLWPAVATLWAAWNKFNALTVPHPGLLTLAGFGALMVNVTCAYMLVRFREYKGSMSKAAFLSARNDAIANVAIIVSGLITALTLSGWPDLIVGLGIAVINAGAAKEVWEASRQEHKDAKV